MKRVLKFFGAATVTVSLLAVYNVSAQTGAASGTQYGKGQDSITCMRNLSILVSDYRSNNYDDAIVYWRKVWRDCPLSSANLTLWGANMYRYYIDRELDQSKKNALIDSLIFVWERGISLRPQSRNTYQTSLMQDMIKYADTPDNQPKLLKVMENLMALQNPAAYYYYMRIIFSQNKEGKVSDEELLDIYTKVSDDLSEAIKKTNDEKVVEELAKARDNIDEGFVNSSAADCENMIKIYSEKYDDNKNDADYLRKMTRLLSRKDCTGSELFEKASEQQYALNPSSEAAYNMAMLFIRRDNFEKAIEYFEHAIKEETNSTDKARYNWLLGNIMFSKNRFADAKKYAVEASRLRPDWGEPYILLAETYANGPKCGGDDDFENRYVYWVVVDKFQKAKSVDPDVASKVDPRMKAYTQLFPKKDEGFFRGINEGASVTVSCWINETTKVRYPN